MNSTDVQKTLRELVNIDKERHHLKSYLDSAVEYISISSVNGIEHLSSVVNDINKLPLICIPTKKEIESKRGIHLILQIAKYEVDSNSESQPTNAIEEDPLHNQRFAFVINKNKDITDESNTKDNKTCSHTMSIIQIKDEWLQTKKVMCCSQSKINSKLPMSNNLLSSP